MGVGRGTLGRQTHTEEDGMDTRLASVGKNMYPEGLTCNCLNELREKNLVDVTGRFRVDPMDERIQKVMRKYHTTLFVL